ncbi:Fic family protein [Arabiibacter massiliensis]|uniref:Fic family protein n=1 Tax=Arabiibacter massiliensis TaxID=1870985 RepID=UPI0009BAD3DC|nr:Fic family protein [Arabiibacter massiliensis]
MSAEKSTAEYREDVPYVESIPETTMAQRRDYWETAKGLQATDGLEVSKYADEQAGRYIEGELSAEELSKQIAEHYSEQAIDDATRTREADEVSARMVKYLEGGAFRLAPSTLFAIHRHIFDGVLDESWVGVARCVNLTKAEPVLVGRSVAYADYTMIKDQLAYDFEQEGARPYRLPLDSGQIERFADFVSNVWQTHPFREGNTRTIALFSQLYLRSLGVDVNNAPFAENSAYFRDALARANYASIREGIREDRSFLYAFFSNVALGASNPLVGDRPYL